MTVLDAAVVVLAIVVLLCLLLLLGIVRRLRDLTERLHRLERGRPPVDTVPANLDISDFTATSLRGEPVSADWLVGEESVVAFLTYGCSACKVQLPLLREHAETPGGKILIVAALVPGEEPEPAALRAEVGDAPVIVEEQFGGPIQYGFRVDKYPTFYLVGADGVPKATAGSLRDLLRARTAVQVGATAG
ncbi:hypothetical protein ABT297_17585 [Dactylosporangium sp. NPDC000555]|uniref:TlpA family protein disulfide reductase n=1 Tax=Dactylosporangium sp. NPDC000555 TaxID=3154260 RepID=UPI003324F6E9